MSQQERFLFISFEATVSDPLQALIQQVTLTFAEREQNKLTLLKEVSFFVDQYTTKDFFDLLSDIPLAEEPSYRGAFAELQIDKRYSKEEALTLIQKSVNYASYIVVHNGLDYHIPILKREGIDFQDKLILDTAVHIEYPNKVKSRKLLHLCAEHNFLPYIGEQRPRTVSLNHSMMTLLNLYSVEATLSKLLEDKKNCIKLRAVIDYSQNEGAKELGFKFDYTTKQWLQMVSQERYDELLLIMGSQHLQIIN